MSTSADIFSVDQEIDQATKLYLEHNEKAITDAIERLQGLLNRPDLSVLQKQNITLNLARAYQRRGDHHAAIDGLNSMEGERVTKQEQIIGAYIKHLGAVSYCALGFFKESCAMFDQAIKELQQLDADPKLRAADFLEAGKAFRACVRNPVLPLGKER